MNCFGDTSKFPDFMEQQIKLEANEMEPDLHPAHGQASENYK